MARILVTGGCGFIGSHLVDALLRDEHEVVILDNLSSGKMENIQHVSTEVQFYKEDVRDLDALRVLMNGVDYVCHEAAISSVPGSIADPLTANEVNVTGTLNVLMAAREAKVKRVIFASSSAVYGDAPTLPKIETMRPMPMSPYAASKLAGETCMQVFYHSYGLETVSLRYFNVFGPRQDPHSQYAAVIPRFITALLNDDKPTIYGDGTQSRDFVYVQNVVQANLLAMRAEQTRGEAVNISCGKATSINTLLSTLCELCGKDVQAAYAERRQGDVAYSLGDCKAATELLGYVPTISFWDGIRLTLDWFTKRL